MSKTIDSSVVSMEFDNSKFEKNVKKTLGTLDKLKKALKLDKADKTFDGIQKAANRLTFKHIENGVETLNQKFSLLGTASRRIMERMVDDAYNTGKRIAKSLSVDQITEGWKKYEEKTSSVQTIMNATGKSIDEVNAYLKKLMWFSDETSYGFTDMTSALATMTSSGGDIEKIIPLMEGVANATAFAGKSAAEFSRIMQFSVNQAYSAGYMQLMDWKTIQGATVNSKQLMEALIEAGEEVGTLAKGQVDVGGFNSSLADKWLTAEVMEKGFGKFAAATEAIYEGIQKGEYENYTEGLREIGDLYGETARKAAAAAQEAKSYGEALDATKDAVSSSWLTTFELIFGNYEEGKHFWTSVTESLWDIFASGGESRNNRLKNILNDSYDSVLDTIEEAGGSIADFERVLLDTAKSFGYDTDALIEEHGSIKEIFKQGIIPNSIIKLTLTSMSEVDASVEAVGSSLEEMQSLVDRIWNGEFGIGETRYKKLTEAGYDYEAVQKLVNKTQNGVKLTLEDLDKETLKSIGLTEEQAEVYASLAEEAKETGTSLNDLIKNVGKKSGRQLALGSLTNILQTIGSLTYIIRDGVSDIFGSVTDGQVYGALKKIYDVTAGIKNYVEENEEGVLKVVKAVLAPIDILFTVLGYVKDAIVGVINASGKFIKINPGKTVGLLADKLLELRDWVKNSGKIENVINGVIGTIADRAKNAYKWVKSLVKGDGLPSLSKSFSGILDSFKQMKKISPSEIFKSIITSIREFRTTISNASRDTFENARAKFDEFFANLSDRFNKFKKWLSENIKIDLPSIIATGLSIGLVTTMAKFVKAVKRPLDAVSDFLEGFSDLGSTLVEHLDAIGTATEKFIKSKTMKVKGEAFLSFAKAILIIAGAIVLLALIPRDKLIKGGIALLGIIAAISVVALAAKKLSLKDLGKMSGVFLSMAASLILVVGAMRRLDKLKNPIRSALIAVGIMAAMMLMVKYMAKSQTVLKKGEKYVNTAKSIQKLSAALLVVATAMMMLSLIKPERMLTSIFGLAACIGAIFLITKIASKVRKYNFKPILQAASSLIIMATSLFILSLIKPERMLNGLINMAIVIAALIPLMIAIRIAGKKSSGIGKTIISIAGSLLLIVVAMKLFEFLDGSKMNTITRIILKIMGMFLALVVVVGIVDKFKRKSDSTGTAAKVILAIGAALISIAAAMLMLSVLRQDKLNGAIDAIKNIMKMFALVIASTFLSKDASKTIISIAITLGVIALALAILTIPDTDKLREVTKMMDILLGIMAGVIASTKFAQNAIKGLVKLGIVVGALFVIAGLMEHFNLAPSIQTVASMAILIGALVGAVSLLNLTSKGADTKKTTKAILQVGLLGAIVIGLGALIGILNKYGVGIDMSIETAGSIALLLVALAGVVALLDIASKDADTKNTTKAILQIGLLGAIVVGLGAIIGVLKKVGVDATIGIETALSMSLLLAALVGCYTVLALLGDKDVDTSTIMKMAALGAIVAIIMGILGLMEGARDGAIIGIETAESFALILTALSASVFILSKAKTDIATGTSAVVMLGELIVLLAGVITALGAIDLATDGELSRMVETGIPLFISLGEGLGQFIGKIVGGIFSGAIDAIANLSKIGDSMATFCESVKGMDEKDVTAVKAVTEAFMLLAAADLISGLGRIVGFISGKSGGISGFTGQLVEAAPNLVTFGNIMSTADISNIEKGCEVISMISDTANGLGKHDGLWQKLTGDNKISDFVRMLATCFVPSFGSNVSPFETFVNGLSEYTGQWDTIMSDIDGFSDVVTKVSTLGDTLSRHDGLLQKVLGDNKINDFFNMVADCFVSSSWKMSGGESLDGPFPRFAEALLHYAYKYDLIQSATESFIKVVTTINEGTSDLSAIGGVTGWWSGESNKLKDFFKDVAKSLDSFSDYVSKIKEISTPWNTIIAKTGSFVETINKFEDVKIGEEYQKLLAGNPMTNLAVDIEYASRYIADFYNSLKGMTGNKLISLGTSVADFLDIISKVKWNKDLDLKKIGNGIKNLTSDLSETLTGSFATFVAGVTLYAQEYETIKTNTNKFFSLVELIQSKCAKFDTLEFFLSWLKGDKGFNRCVSDIADSIMHDFATYTTEITKYTKSWDTIKDNTVAFGEVVEKISEINVDPNYSTLFSKKPLSAATADLSSSAANMKTFYNNLNGVDIDRLSKLTDSVKDALNELPSVSVDETKAINGVSESLSALSKNIVDYFNSNLVAPERLSTLNGAGSVLASAIVTGLGTKTVDISSAATKLYNSFKDQWDISASYTTVYQIGVNFCQGLINGMNSKIDAIATVASNLGNKGISFLRAALDVHSPSKITEKIGEFFTQGFVNGIDEDSDGAFDSAVNLGTKALNGLKDIGAKIGDYINTEITQPVISPILDLDSIKTGANEMYGMFSDQLSIGTTSNYAQQAMSTSSKTPNLGNINFTIYGAQGQDVNQLADLVSKKLNTALTRRYNTWR